MIDFKNASYLKMKQVKNTAFAEMIEPMLAKEEHIVASYQTVRDGVVFTDKRIIAINVQGVTGKKKDFTSLPYSRIQAFSVETAGVLDLDAEMELWFSGRGKVKFEFTASTDVSTLCKFISTMVLN